MAIRRRFDIEHYRIVLAGPVSSADAAGAVAPDQIVAKVLRPEHGVKRKAQVCVGVVVAVQVEAAAGLEYAVYLYEAHSHVGQVGGGGFAVRIAGGVYDLGKRGIVVVYPVYPLFMHIVFPAPDVLELGVVICIRPIYPGVNRLALASDAPCRQGFQLQLALIVG